MDSRFHASIQRFDQENARDPNLENYEGTRISRELLYARRLTDWVCRLDPNASEPLRLAARCQHLCRWKIPRQDFPMTRAGYLLWRNTLKKFHADLASSILKDCGYDPETIQSVRDLNLKSNFPADPDSRTLEDALCLVFLQFQFPELAAKTSDEKMINALRKSWGKMTERARSIALTLEYGPRERQLLEQALKEVA